MVGIAMMKELSRQEDALDSELEAGEISPAEYRFHLKELYDEFNVDESTSDAYLDHHVVVDDMDDAYDDLLTHKPSVYALEDY